MGRLLAMAVAASIVLMLPCSLASQAEKLTAPQATLAADIPSSGMGALPPMPSGTSTIFGGAIRKIDPVRDQIVLDVRGMRPMKILFDERTQVFRDGIKIPLRELKPTDHASVQTTLDGTSIFAMSIHILSQLPQGEYRGRVVSFNRTTGELKMDAGFSPQSLRIVVPGNAKILRTGQSSFTTESSGSVMDLEPGSLVDVSFSVKGNSEGQVSQIVVLAVPGASFVFSGDITALDVGSGFLTVVDPRDQKAYRIEFNPGSFADIQNLRVGQRVRIVANYEGGNYLASNISAF